MARPPKVFAGSSTEAKPIANLCCEVIDDAADVLPWFDAPEFKKGFATIDSLIDAASSYDFGVFLLTPDDTIETRGMQLLSARDRAAAADE